MTTDDQYVPTDEEVRTDYVTAYTDQQSSQLLAGMAFDRWLAKRDDLIRRQQRYIEELEAGRITPRTHLAAQNQKDPTR